VLDLPHAAQRLRPGGQSPTAGLPLYGFELKICFLFAMDRAQGCFPEPLSIPRKHFVICLTPHSGSGRAGKARRQVCRCMVLSKWRESYRINEFAVVPN
jgi:hypothetical protein